MSVHYYRKGNAVKKGDPADTWSVRYRIGTKHPRRTFKKEHGFTAGDAEEFDRSMKRKKRMGGVDPLAAERPFDRVIEEWWRSYEPQVSAGRATKVRAYLDNRILKVFPGYRLCDITPPVVEELKVGMEEAGVGAPTVRAVLYVLSAIFEHAQRMGYVTHNPTTPIRKPAASTQRLIQPFPPERVEQIRNYFLERDNLESATMVSVLAYAGPRPEEAHDRLTWADILDKGIIFRGQKNGKDRSTLLLAPLREDLKAWQKQSGMMVGQIFGWGETYFNTWRDDSYWRKMVEDLDLVINGRRARPYDLRHAFATLLAAEGKGIDYISRQLGNSHTTCERYYRHLVDDVDEPRSAEERIYEARKQSTPATNRKAI